MTTADSKSYELMSWFRGKETETMRIQPLMRGSLCIVKYAERNRKTGHGTSQLTKWESGHESKNQNAQQ